VTIFKDCAPADPRALWDNHWIHICDDLERHHAGVLGIHSSQKEVQDYGLYFIDQLLAQSRSGKRLHDWDSMPQIMGDWAARAGNPLFREQLQYNLEDQGRLAQGHIGSLNLRQQTAFEQISTAVTDKTGKTFFLHGPGGTGKTYLYNTLCYHLRSQGMIVLCVASSGIAALLLMGGCTSHSRFKIPIPIHESSVCSISKRSHFAELIQKTDLVIWDETPMQHKHVMKTVDHTFRDLRGSDNPFGGLSVVFRGDFQQLLPVIVKGSRAQVVGGCMQRSFLWRSFTVLHLQQSMRLNDVVQEEADFAKWQLDVGHGQHTDEDCNITLPERFMCREYTVDSLIDTIYPGITAPHHDPDSYFSDVDSLNEAILQRFPGDIHTFHSADFIPNSEQTGKGDPMLNYPVEYLNKINCFGMLLAKLELKVGCPVIMLKNLDAAHGVCNGSRRILTNCRNRVLEVKLLTEHHAGDKVFIPRIYNQPSDNQNALKFTRKQFPVCLRFSMTVNKSQGQSVKHVGLDLRSPVFTHGRGHLCSHMGVVACVHTWAFYVAVSRVTSVGNIKAIEGEEEKERKTKNVVYKEVLLN
jgi:hypothetical protein